MNQEIGNTAKLAEYLDPHGRVPPALPAAPTRRWRVRFSLGTLLFAALFAGAVILLIQITRENERLKENREFRVELGILDIQYPEKAYLLAPKSKNSAGSTHWSWSVYLPKNKTFKYSKALTEIPKDGVFSKPPMGSASLRQPADQFTVNASIERDENGKPQFVITGDVIGRFTSKLFNATWLDDNSSMVNADLEIGGLDRQEEFNPGQPIVLLRIRKPKTAPMPGTTGEEVFSADPCPGLLLWIWEEKNADQPAPKTGGG